MKDEFRTIKNSGESIFKDRGSKFYGFAIKVNSVDDAKNELKSLRVKFHNARHHCYAYRIHPVQTEERANDDGEPSNTAGTPILNQIYSAQLYNVLIVVVRYFGGTKLGVPGLINAYKTAAKEAIEDADLITKEITERIKLTTDYAHVNNLMRIVKQKQLKIVAQNSFDKMEIIVDVKVSMVDEINTLVNKGNQIIFEAIKKQS